ncbi:MAG: phage major capsid protein [Gammaproteobacteria bacterium]|nr:phage major capsid protein [Gammaproteobacteria bacterium]
MIVVSKQVLADENQLQQTLGDLFRYRVLEFFERQVVIGTGVGRNVLGLATAATASGATGGNAADRLGATGSLLADMGWEANLVILNPNDWHTIRSERADTGNGQYLSGGWAQPAQPSIWSMPVVSTSSLPVGTALVMDTAAALVLDREAPTVLISSEDLDNFVKNMVTILAEMRGGLAILNPSAILSVALTP